MEVFSMRRQSTLTSRLNVLYILTVLKKYSNEQHPLSIADITEKVNTLFLSDKQLDTPLNISTVSRIFDALLSDAHLGFSNIPMEHYLDSADLGFNIYCVIKNEKNEWNYYPPSKSKKEEEEEEEALFNQDDTEKKKKKKSPKKYYYYESVFTDAEIKTLIDSIETYNYFSTDDISNLVAKLGSLRPMLYHSHNYNSTKFRSVKDENSLVLPNIDMFNQIIQSQQFARIVYCTYNHKKELVPRPKYPRVIKPLSMMWSNGYYYLVALLGPTLSPAHLRLDRITEIEPIIPTSDMRKEYENVYLSDASNYRLNHPSMFTGKLQHITMLCEDTLDSGMLNIIMDTFGQPATIRPASKKELEEHLSPNIIKPWVRVDIEATAGGVAKFAQQNCCYCKVIFPESLSQKIKENLTTALNFYSNVSDNNL